MSSHSSGQIQQRFFEVQVTSSGEANCLHVQAYKVLTCKMAEQSHDDSHMNSLTSLLSPSSVSSNELQRQINAHLRLLAERYAHGELEIADVAHEMGAAWTVTDILWQFDQMGVARVLEKISLNDSDRQVVLSRLADMRGWIPQEFNSPERVNREVIASQRIEGIHVALHDLP